MHDIYPSFKLTPMLPNFLLLHFYEKGQGPEKCTIFLRHKGPSLISPFQKADEIRHALGVVRQQLSPRLPVLASEHIPDPEKGNLKRSLRQPEILQANICLQTFNGCGHVIHFYSSFISLACFRALVVVTLLYLCYQVGRYI